MQNRRKASEAGVAPIPPAKQIAGMPLSRWKLLEKGNAPLMKDEPKSAGAEIPRMPRDTMLKIKIAMGLKETHEETLWFAKKHCEEMHPQDAVEIFSRAYEYDAPFEDSASRAIKFAFAAPESLGAALRSQAVEWVAGQNFNTTHRIGVLETHMKKAPSKEKAHLIGLMICAEEQLVAESGMRLIKSAPKGKRAGLWILAVSELRRYSDLAKMPAEYAVENCGKLKTKDALLLFEKILSKENGEAGRMVYGFSWRAPERMGVKLRKMAVEWCVKHHMDDAQKEHLAHSVEKLGENERVALTRIMVGKGSNCAEEGLWLIGKAPKSRQMGLWKIGKERVQQRIERCTDSGISMFNDESEAIARLEWVWKLPLSLRVAPIEAAVDVAIARKWKKYTASVCECMRVLPEKEMVRLAHKLARLEDFEAFGKLFECNPIACSSSFGGVLYGGRESMRIRREITGNDRGKAEAVFCIIPLAKAVDRAWLIMDGIAHERDSGWWLESLQRAGKMILAVPMQDRAQVVGAMIDCGMCVFAFDGKGFRKIIESAPEGEQAGLYERLAKRVEIAIGANYLPTLRAAMQFIPIVPRKARAELIEKSLQTTANWKGREIVDDVAKLIPLAERKEQKALREKLREVKLRVNGK